ncbi:MAG TPA: hypothetical protein VHX11_07800 [Acidobacteriaceae bacterium]|jgi:hypothetical protein|nr:hypothetical protein [Acidobacteriaceae bacterium]
MRKLFVRLLLSILNSRWLNHTPCKYEFVGNVDAFSRSDIEYRIAGSPEITLRQYLDAADRFKACPISRVGVTAIEPDGSYTRNVDFR